MKSFADMTPAEKVDHCERCIKSAYEELQNQHGPVELADILDVWDYWTPYLIDRVRKLEAAAKIAAGFYEREGQYCQELGDLGIEP